jgi:hypothetical protein
MAIDSPRWNVSLIYQNWYEPLFAIRPKASDLLHGNMQLFTHVGLMPFVIFLRKASQEEFAVLNRSLWLGD